MRGLGTATVLIMLAACSPEQAPAPVPAAETALVDVDTSAINYRGIWSANGQRLFDRQELSPNRRYMLEWTPRGIEITGAWQGILEGVKPNTAPELLWSPNDSLLANSWSEGGAVGPWRINVFDFSETPRDTDISQLFFLPFGCASNGANVAAVAWLDDTDLLIAAERPRSSCMSDSMVTGIRVSLEEGQHGSEIPEDVFITSWRKHMGPRVLNAANIPPQ